MKEKLNYNELEEVYKTVVDTVPFNFERVISMDMKTKETKILKPEESKGNLYNEDNIIINYKKIFSDYQDFKTSDILKFEFNSYEWLMIMMGTDNNNNRLAHMAFSPDLYNLKLVSRIGNILKNFGFRIFPQKDKKELHESLEFIDKLITIFRHSSGRYYSSSLFSRAYSTYNTLKNDYPRESQLFIERKKEILPNGLECYRRLGGINRNVEWVRTNGEIVKTEDLKVGDKVYYTTYNREFSQWAEKSVGNDLSGILSDDSFELEANIPTDKIVYSNSMLPAGFSPHVIEGEVIVEHGEIGIDKGIICTITKNRYTQK